MPTTARITKREAADILGCDPSTVNRMVTAGDLKPCQTIEHAGRVTMYLFRRTDVQRLATKRAAS